MNEKPTQQSNSTEEASSDDYGRSGPVVGARTNTINWKKILCLLVAAVVLFLLKDLLFGLMQLTITIALIAAFGVIGYSLLQMQKQKGYGVLALTVEEQNPFLSERSRTYKRDPNTLMKAIQDYFLEKTWGLSGLRWRINNCDTTEGKIVADFECSESIKGELLPASATYTAGPPKSFGIFPAVLASSKTALRRYAVVRLEARPTTTGGTTLDYEWEFRYTEQTDTARPPAVPPALFAVCKDLPQTLTSQEL